MELVDATFKWLKENIRDKIDFVVWTGDSARHDSDEEIPRTAEQILHTNTYIAEKFEEVFGNGGSNHNPSDMDIPVVPTFGNNDFMPHNILLAGPNKWLNTYTSLWRKFIPEAQRHGFQRGGWFYVEVIPNKLAVFSLNSMYFFTNNAGVDGCASRYEPGYEHMEWLRVQLQLMRERGMKVILESHVGPARTPSKQLWDETCWQKYTLWMQQYRDIVITGLYGHMNIDHFMLQDTQQVDILGFNGLSEEVREYLGDELTINSAGDYLEELRTYWSTLPNPAAAFEDDSASIQGGKKNKKGRKDKKKEREKQEALKKIGGKWAERFQLSIVGPSVVPNYFPTVRVFEYNITGLDYTKTWASQQGVSHSDFSSELRNEDIMEKYEYYSQVDAKSGADELVKAANTGNESPEWYADFETTVKKHKKKKGKNEKKPVDPDLHIPLPPTPGTPPGPAYSPQPFTLIGYTQYYANLTEINDDMTDAVSDGVESRIIVGKGWHAGKHKGRNGMKLPDLPKDEPHVAKFHYEVEYSTFNDSKGYNLDDLTVRSYLKLAHRIGRYEEEKGKGGKKNFWMDSEDENGEEDDDETESTESALHKLQDVFKGYVDIVSDMFDATDAPHPHHESPSLHISHVVANAESAGDAPGEVDSETIVQPAKKRREHRKKHDKKRNRHGRNRNNAWRTFLRRAFVGTLDEDDLEKFDVAMTERAEDAAVLVAEAQDGVGSGSGSGRRVDWDELAQNAAEL